MTSTHQQTAILRVHILKLMQPGMWYGMREIYEMVEMPRITFHSASRQTAKLRDMGLLEDRMFGPNKRDAKYRLL